MLKSLPGKARKSQEILGKPRETRAPSRPKGGGGDLLEAPAPELRRAAGWQKVIAGPGCLGQQGFSQDFEAFS